MQEINLKDNRLTEGQIDFNLVFEELYSKLNAEQKHAVDTIEGPVMVLAGPGTGKTQIIAMRIANILRNPDLQMSPHNILCLTFTESGVAAMRNRLISIIGPTAYAIRIHTFHSFCNEVIKDHPEKFLDFNFISDLEQIEIFNQMIDDLPISSPIKPYGAPYLYRNDLISSIKTLKRESISPEDLLKTVNDTEALLKKYADIIEAFVSQNARKLKDEDCLKFLEDTNEIQYFSNFWQQAEKIAEFKKKVKDFYEKGLRDIPKQKDLAHIYKQYLDELEKRSLYDFEDMILNVINAFKEDTNLLREYQEQFQYVLVDEYQDTNGAQNKVMELLTGFHSESPNIFVVGDDDQSIFRFQGASVENVVAFYRKFQEQAEIIVLDKNYRSQQHILDAAFSSINYNQTRISNIISSITKQLNAQQDFELNPVQIHEYETVNDEIFGIGNRIKELIAQGINPNEISVLFRDNRDIEKLMEAFSRMDIPFSVETGDNILENIQICQLIDIFKIIENPEVNSDLLFNSLNYDFVMKAYGYSVQDIFAVTRKRRQQKPEEKLSFIQFLLEDERFSAYANGILNAHQKAENLKFDNFFEYVINEFNYLNYILASNEKIQHLNRLNTLFEEIKVLASSRSPIYRTKSFSSKTNKLFDIKDFIKYIDLLLENGIKLKSKPIKTNSNAIQLMTAHKSKGLEFEYVFIYKFLDKHWSNKRDLAKLKLPAALIENTGSANFNQDKNEDDRRLFYVALTRAKKEAHISYHALNDKNQEQVPALFLAELPPVQSSDKTKKHNHRDQVLDSKEQAELLTTQFSQYRDNLAEVEEAYLRELLEDYKLSATHLNHYLKCPRMFFYQDLLRVPSAANKFSSFGVAIHAALYDLFLSFNHNPDFANQLDYLLARFESHLQDQAMSDQDYRDSLDFGKDSLTNYYNRYKDVFIKQTFLEYDFNYKGLNVEGIPLTGKADKLELINDSGVEVVNLVDYKTGNPSNKSKELKPGGEYFRQVAFYKLLIDEANKSQQFKPKMVSGEIDFVQASSDGTFSKKQILVANEDLAALKEEIKLTYKNIQALKFDKTDDKSHCEKCRFASVCMRLN